MEINDRLKAIFEDNETELQELANEMGVNRRQLTRWTKGEAEMGIYKLKKICEIYGISADYILGLPKGLSWPR